VNASVGGRVGAPVDEVAATAPEPVGLAVADVVGAATELVGVAVLVAVADLLACGAAVPTWSSPPPRVSR
jgi:hypothetical protein